MLDLLLAFADLHLGDRDHLLRSLREAMEKAVDLAARGKPDRLTLLINGDAVAGRGIFRGQEVQNILQLGEEQVLVAAWLLRDFVVRLSEAAGVPLEEIQVQLILGHHDHSNKENLALRLAATLRLMGVKVRYNGREWIGDYRPYGHVLARHGHGKSDYYAVTFSEIRGAWKTVVDEAIRSYGEVVIRRLIFAHSHWFNTGIPLSQNLEADVLGGWSRPPESKLNWYMDRPTGAIAYWFDERGLQLDRIQPEPETFWDELRDPDLPLDNVAEAARVLKEASRWAREQGRDALDTRSSTPRLSQRNCCDRRFAFH